METINEKLDYMYDDIFSNDEYVGDKNNEAFDKFDDELKFYY
ncbi:hypothetical protein [Clostridium novyi]|uniref:Uncharacterized protein n=1 Tax=Clostridium novyi (strain NT) TaxID=386415 RepID=A0Q2S5_CLONN|nr:hypothetical protein [Clostridium novyi]ABK62463.1 hypothetical protein NT01CX_0456 [Clostridium novyi NT]